MSTTATRRRRPVPTTFAALIAEHVPVVIRDRTEYEAAAQMLDRLTLVPKFNDDQRRYFETLVLVITDYEAEHCRVGKRKFPPLEHLRDFVEDHKMTLKDLGALLGVSESAASMILKGDRALTVSHIRKLSKRFKVNPSLFID